MKEDERQWPWYPGGDLSNHQINGDIYRSPHILEFSDVYGIPCSRVLQWARDLISSPKLQDAMGTLQYPHPTRVEAVEGVTLYCGSVTGYTRLLTYGKGRRQHTHIVPWNTSSFPGLSCIPNHLIGGAGEKLVVATMYTRWQLC